jgi:hypothetical protein
VGGATRPHTTFRRGAERYAYVAAPQRFSFEHPLITRALSGTVRDLPFAGAAAARCRPQRHGYPWLWVGRARRVRVALLSCQSSRYRSPACMICCCRRRNKAAGIKIGPKIKFVLCELAHTYLMSGRRKYDFEGELMLCSTLKLDTGTTYPEHLCFFGRMPCAGFLVFCVTVATTLLATVPLSAQLPPSPSSLSSLSSRGCASGIAAVDLIISEFADELKTGAAMLKLEIARDLMHEGDYKGCATNVDNAMRELRARE